jgi:hypothetical protein
MLQGLTNYYVSENGRMVEKPISLSNAMELYAQNSTSAYPSDFFSKLTRCKDWQISLGTEIGRKYGVKSAVDFGCGLGFYLEGIRRTGLATKLLGFEMSYDNAKNYMPTEIKPYIQYGNVMEKIDCGIFDLSISIEVAEHILPEKSDVLVDNITSASSQYIFFSAAVPGQGGTCHINEQPHLFWIEKIEKKGFVFSKIDTKNIVDIMNGLPYHSKYYNLMKKQILFFKRR